MGVRGALHRQYRGSKGVLRMKEEEILRLQDVSFSYGDGRRALSHVNLGISAGERIAVLGPNGAGKSTLFLLMNGVFSPSSGSIYFRDRKIMGRQINVLRKGVGIIFQDADSQIIAPSVRSEISFGPMNLGLTAAEVEQRVEYAAAFMQLKGFEDRPPHALSGGEKKRVSIADIIAMEPEVFLFDEPAASLDCAGTEALEQVLAELGRQGKTLLISTHDVDFAWRWAQRVIVLQNGTITGDGTLSSVFAQKELLKKANIKCPMMLRLTEMLEQKNLLREKGRAPKTPEELEALLVEH